MPHRIVFKIRTSVSAKIALIVTLPVVLFTAFFSYQNYLHDREAIFRNAELQLMRIGEGLKDTAEEFIKKKNYAGLQEAIARAGLNADIELIAVYSRQEIVIACNKKQWIGKGLFDLHPTEITETDIDAVRKAFSGGYKAYYDPGAVRYNLVMPVSSGREDTGAAHISLDIKNAQAEIKKKAAGTFLVTVPASALIGVIIYFLFHFLLANRIKSVSSAAVKFAAGDMQARVDGGGTDEIGYLATSFNLLADEITNWRTNLEEMAASRVRELSALYEVVDTISQSLDLKKVLPNVLDRVLENVAAGKGVVALVGSDGKTLTLMAQRGLSEEGTRRISQEGRGCVADVILKNSPVRLPSGNALEAEAIPGLEQEGVRSALVVPISARGFVYGAIGVYSGKKDKFSAQDEALLASIGSQVGVAVENARLYEKTLELAQLDGLTGLDNRRYLMERLDEEVERAGRYQTSLSVMIIDLDKFKSFNDTYGHLKGDELLKAFSGMIKGILRLADIAGRYGGEEFCIVLPNTSIKGAAVIAERIRKAMGELTITVGGGRPPEGRTVSIGIAEFSAEDSVEKLLAAADAALYRAKEGGRNRVEG